MQKKQAAVKLTQGLVNKNKIENKKQGNDMQIKN